MFVIETKHFKKEHLNKEFVVGNLPDYGLIQCQDDNEVILREWYIPYMCVGNTQEAVCMTLTEQILGIMEKSNIVMVFENHIETPTIRYNFRHSDFVAWETFVPNISCILEIPDPPEFDNEIVAVKVSKHHLEIQDGGTAYVFPLLYQFEENTIEISSEFLYSVLCENIGKPCKLYVNPGSPLCMEFFTGSRLFVAPWLG